MFKQSTQLPYVQSRGAVRAALARHKAISNCVRYGDIVHEPSKSGISSRNRTCFEYLAFSRRVGRVFSFPAGTAFDAKAGQLLTGQLMW